MLLLGALHVRTVYVQCIVTKCILGTWQGYGRSLDNTFSGILLIVSVVILANSASSMQKFGVETYNLSIPIFILCDTD
jgi:hypothetical protein